VVKALLDAKLLPRVIAGTSCGSLIAALIGTRTDEELKKLLVPELAHKITGELSAYDMELL
jgi:predicted acylesterase/phospholipase RssA